ncbi:MAG: aminotransferase class V-fold PLP-dependent enzyme, partial [Candidatus Nanohaloarchaea archaeon]
AVRSGMHCVHSWFHEKGEEPAVRASLHLYNDEEDIRRFLSALDQVAKLG